MLMYVMCASCAMCVYVCNVCDVCAVCVSVCCVCAVCVRGGAVPEEESDSIALTLSPGRAAAAAPVSDASQLFDGTSSRARGLCVSGGPLLSPGPGCVVPLSDVLLLDESWCVSAPR